MASRSNLELRGTDRNGNRTGARPTVGQADPATRRKLLNQRLTERQPASSRPAPAAATTTAVGQPDAFKVQRAASDLRNRGAQIDRYSK